MNTTTSIHTITLHLIDSTRETLLRALVAEDARLLTWLSKEDDNLSAEWATKYDDWQNVVAAREALERS